MKRLSMYAAVVLPAALIAGCSGNNTAQSTASAPSISGVPPDKTHFKPMSNGQAIFQSGRDLSGVRIASSPPPLRTSCAACHNSDGSGGVHLPGGAVSADLRRNALVNGQKTPYTISLLERAISSGVDNRGEKLDPVMPRWKMSSKDLHDVAAYVLTLR